jgi:hypothetical protein
MLAVVCLILLIAGALCFLAAAFPQAVTVRRVNLVALGLFFWVMVALIDAAKALH